MTALIIIGIALTMKLTTPLITSGKAFIRIGKASSMPLATPFITVKTASKTRGRFVNTVLTTLTMASTIVGII